MVKNPSAMQETWVQSLSQEDPPEKGMVTHSSKKRRGLQTTRCLDSIITSMDMSGSKLQETVKDRGDWHTAVHRVTKSWTQFSN